MEHPHLSHRPLKVKNSHGETLHGVLVDRRERQADYCIVFMHGLASNTLEAATIIDHLLPNTALFAFDFAGSGRSGGTCCTYGLKEHEDVPAVLALLEAEGFRQFVLWGRSMGAVACLLHTLQHPDDRVVLQVVDSPFCSFAAVCEGYAQRFMGVPELLVAPALAVLRQTFSGHAYDPFRIDLLALADRCSTPTLFVYNEQDEVIAASNTEELIRRLPPACYYERLAIGDPHNHVRSSRTTALVFEKLRRLLRTAEKGREERGRGRRRGFDVLSSLVKRGPVELQAGKAGEGREGFRRSAIYCSLSKKNSCFLSPKTPLGKRDNPELFSLNTNS
jgi:pimeloyl-ACP methyl ester carboxylesterase